MICRGPVRAQPPLKLKNNEMQITTQLRMSYCTKTAILAPLLLLTGCVRQPAAAAAPPPPSTTKSAKADDRAVAEATTSGFDAMLVHGSTQTRFLAPSGDKKETARAAAVLAAFARVSEPTDVVEVGPGTFDFGNQPPVMLPKCKIKGQGKGSTLFVSQKQIDPYERPSRDPAARREKIAGGTAWCFQDGTVVEDISFTDDCFNPGEDGGCIGFLSETTGATAVMRRCACWCRDWTVYNWSPNNRLLIEDCELTTGRVALAADNSGDGQQFYVIRTRIFGDASLSKSIGATSNKKTGGVFGAVCRGGRTRLIDCEINLKGGASTAPSFTPRAAAITDSGGANGAPAANTRIEIYNLRSSIDPNGADPAQCFDLDLRHEYVRKQLRCNLSNCWGSAADGGLKKNF